MVTEDKKSICERCPHLDAGVGQIPKCRNPRKEEVADVCISNVRRYRPWENVPGCVHWVAGG